MTDIQTKLYILEKRLETLEKKNNDVPHMKGLIPREGDILVFSEGEKRFVPANIEKFTYMWLSHGSDKKIEACRFGHPHDCEGDMENDRKRLQTELNIWKQRCDTWEKKNKEWKKENEALKAKIAMLESSFQSQNYFQNIE